MNYITEIPYDPSGDFPKRRIENDPFGEVFVPKERVGIINNGRGDPASPILPIVEDSVKKLLNWDRKTNGVNIEDLLDTL